MILRDKHLQAIARAQHFIRSGITPMMSLKHIEQVENDIFLLDQVHMFLRVAMNEPCLPVVPDLCGHSIDKTKNVESCYESDGHTST